MTQPDRLQVNLRLFRREILNAIGTLEIGLILTSQINQTFRGGVWVIPPRPVTAIRMMPHEAGQTRRLPPDPALRTNNSADGVLIATSQR